MQNQAGTSAAAGGGGFDARAITRPDPVLLKYYVICSLLTGPLAIIILPPLFFKYHTLRYRFDDEGIAASWGILWRHEVYLTYRRIQDIHVNRGIIQRWLGLAGIAVQTASGSAAAELTIEGLLEYEALRDFLYQQMRGAKGQGPAVKAAATATGDAGATAPAEEEAGDEALKLLREIRDELALVRTKLERREVRADGSVGRGAGDGGGA
jgi:putative membrane protein